ncbi:alpha/beta hydrolase family protein [Rhodococcus jostii]|uniref:Alpha/beta hydrolase family protein n=1 Tax=Rhodococcus jostii TaxID=132919 RepID=A0A1H5HCA9_RHOJO|nr:alpha/beta hydrolase [Rhodococcus jostii]SEE25627.1 Alpha/beta hydrolase family protein [Rhodococcus jostii]
MTVRDQPGEPLTRHTAQLTRYDEYAVTVPRSGDPALVAVPQGVTPSAVVYYLHGRTGDQRSIDDRAGLRDGLLDAGYVVAAPYLHGDLWGNRRAQDAVVALDEWVSRRWPVSVRFVIGESMGGNAAANAVRLREAAWDGAVLIAPSLSLRAVWERGEHGRDTVRDAFRLSADGHDLEPKTAGWDAVRHEPRDYAGVPIRVYASREDEVANIAGVTGPWVEMLRRGAGAVELVEVSGAHVSEDHFRAAEVVEFFGALR